MVAADIPACVAVLRGHGPGHDVDEWLARFQRDVDSSEKHPVVAALAGAIVGYARTMPFEVEPGWPANVAPAGYYLLGLVVDLQHRRRGIGTLLTTERLRWLQGRAVEVWYYTHRTNTASQHMHEQLGFARVTDDFWFPGMGDDHGEVLYRLPLSPA
ncbi:MAG: hypothetical protein QOJ79_1498 [Actinomycetota bacterium]|jgi:ribosomal protein S18 acetylase RimI-like enzyme|nr:hypothetical protein [Actinomycetota bacterium]